MACGTFLKDFFPCSKFPKANRATMSTFSTTASVLPTLSDELSAISTLYAEISGLLHERLNLKLFLFQ